jgi:hypothetical protein
MLILGNELKSKNHNTQLGFTAGEFYPEWMLATWPRLVLFFTHRSMNLIFEIGYGKQIIRDQLNAKEDDLVVHMSSQEIQTVIQN